MEKDIILKHMFGATLALPKYRESLLVSLVDDYEAEHEFFGPLRQKVDGWFRKIKVRASI